MKWSLPRNWSPRSVTCSFFIRRYSLVEGADFSFFYLVAATSPTSGAHDATCGRNSLTRLLIGLFFYLQYSKYTGENTSTHEKTTEISRRDLSQQFIPVWICATSGGNYIFWRRNCHWVVHAMEASKSDYRWDNFLYCCLFLGQYFVKKELNAFQGAQMC